MKKETAIAYFQEKLRLSIYPEKNQPFEIPEESAKDLRDKLKIFEKYRAKSITRGGSRMCY